MRILTAVVTVRPPAEFIRQHSSREALSAMDTSSISSASPGTGSLDPPSGHKRNSTQVVTAHDNGQVQVWDMSTGFLQPVLRMGVAGPSARSALPAQRAVFAATSQHKSLCASLSKCDVLLDRQTGHQTSAVDLGGPNTAWGSGLYHLLSWPE